jgi:hypothetical protein
MFLAKPIFNPLSFDIFLDFDSFFLLPELYLKVTDLLINSENALLFILFCYFLFLCMLEFMKILLNGFVFLLLVVDKFDKFCALFDFFELFKALLLI